MTLAREPKILVVEDNATTARSVALFLNQAGFDIRTEATAAEGEQAIAEWGPELVILDLNLPDRDGIELCRAIRTSSAVPIVMLTARSTEDEIVAGLEAGADDYVCKPFGARELVARVRRCHQRAAQTPQPEDVRRIGELELDPARRVVRLAGTPIRLTRSEFDILALLMRHPGRVFTRDQLIAGALGPDFDGYDRTVDTHVWSLRRKLGEPRGAPCYVLSELGIGYRMRDVPADETATDD